MATLFEECIEVLNGRTIILSKENDNNISNEFRSRVPLNKIASKVNWEKIKKHIDVKSEHDIIPAINSLLNSSINNDQVYVLWNNATTLIIRTDLQSIIDYYDDVISVAFETWIYNPDHNYVIECLSNGRITVGLL